MRLRHAAKLSITGIVPACIVCAFLSGPAFSLDRDQSIDQLSYTFWSQKDGAPSEITALAQTSDGFLWIGSDAGLFRFDGVKFEQYKPPPGVTLPSHSINSLLATPDGGLWIAFSPTGLGLLKNGSLTVFTGKSELPDSPIHCFARDHDGRIWAGTETGLVLRHGGRWIRIGRDWNLPREMIRYLLVDREGTLWVATIKRIAFLPRGSRKFELGGTIGTGVTTLAQAKDGRVWLADDGRGVVRPAPLAGRNPESEFPVIVGNSLRELLFDRDGALWITDMESGIVRIPFPEKLRDRKYGPHEPEVQTFSKKDGFSGGFAYKLLEDREGNIWVGCSTGLIRFRRNDVTPVSLPQGYQKLTLLAGNNGGLWVGTISEKPFLHIRGKNFLHESVGEEAVSVLRGANGDVWWGCRAGIWRQRGTRFKYFPLPKPAVPDYMYDLIPSLINGGLWIRLGDNGFVRFRRGVWNFHDWPKGVPSTGKFRHGPSASYRDRSGRVWLGYSSGQVIVLDGKRVTLYSHNDGLDVGRIKVIRGFGEHIWLGGELGLMFFSKGRFQRVTVAGDEQLGAVSGIIATADGGLWLNEMRGIVHFSPEEVRQVIADANHRVKYRRFDYLDGLPGAPQMDFTNSTAVETTDGRLWFATDQGLAMIDPAQTIMNRLPPPVSILSIADRKLRLPISNAVKFSAGTHTIEIDYTALSLSLPERVKFRYSLGGVDTEWQNVGTRRQAYYSNLGPGHYRFRVIACNNDGVWNNVGASIDFSIAPAYYQTLWFRVACLAAFLGLLWAAYRLRLRQLAREFNMTLEARVGERTRIARELHDTLLQSFHGLMLRFQSASNLLPELPVEAKQRLDSAIDQAAEAITEGRDAVQDLRSSTAVTNDLAVAIGTLGQELAANESSNHSAFRIEVEGPPRNLHTIPRDEIYRIAGEALRNAFRHAEARQIEVEIRYDQRQFRLRVRDNGKGIDPALLNAERRPGHWGLLGMHERAKLLGGNLNVWSKLESGTEVELSVPASVAYAKASVSRRLRIWGTTKEEKS